MAKKLAALAAKYSDQEAAAYLAGLIDGEGCVSLCELKNGSQAGALRRVITIGMTDREIIDLAADLFDQLGIGYSRHDKARPGKLRHVWVISIHARIDLERAAELIPIRHSSKREKLQAILNSYKTAKPYARRSDHNSPAQAA